MLSDDVEQIFNEHADEELLVSLSSGESIRVTHPGEVRISGLKMWIFTGLERGRLITKGPVRYVSIVNIASITPSVRRSLGVRIKLSFQHRSRGGSLALISLLPPRP